MAPHTDTIRPAMQTRCIKTFLYAGCSVNRLLSTVTPQPMCGRGVHKNGRSAALSEAAMLEGSDLTAKVSLKHAAPALTSIKLHTALPPVIAASDTPHSKWPFVTGGTLMKR